MVAMETQKDPVLSKVLHFTQHGWPEKPEPAFQPYYSKRLDLTHEDGILLWTIKVIIPESLRSLLLRDLHAEHLSRVKIKQLTRKYLWWPRIDIEIKEIIKLCAACQEAAKPPASS